MKGSSVKTVLTPVKAIELEQLECKFQERFQKHKNNKLNIILSKKHLIE